MRVEEVHLDTRVSHASIDHEMKSVRESNLGTGTRLRGNAAELVFTDPSTTKLRLDVRSCDSKADAADESTPFTANRAPASRHIPEQRVETV